MARRIKRSFYAARIATRPSAFWRRATPAENLKLAGSSKAGRFVPASIPRGKARRNSVSITTTEFKTKQNLERYGEALTPRQAAERRAEGTLGYTSGAAKEQAEKTRVAALRTRAVRYLEQNGEREARLARTVRDVRNHKGENNPPGSYVRTHYRALLERRIAGQALDAGEWHGLMDLVRALDTEGLGDKHPLLRVLANSGTIRGGEGPGVILDVA
jgi:hypothetical protein